MLMEHFYLLISPREYLTLLQYFNYIDYIIINDNNNILYSCIIYRGLTDHFLIACFVAYDWQNHDVSRNSEQSIIIRVQRRFDHDLILMMEIHHLENCST